MALNICINNMDKALAYVIQFLLKLFLNCFKNFLITCKIPELLNENGCFISSTIIASLVLKFILYFYFWFTKSLQKFATIIVFLTTKLLELHDL